MSKRKAGTSRTDLHVNSAEINKEANVYNPFRIFAKHIQSIQ